MVLILQYMKVNSNLLLFQISLFNCYWKTKKPQQVRLCVRIYLTPASGLIQSNNKTVAQDCTCTRKISRFRILRGVKRVSRRHHHSLLQWECLGMCRTQIVFLAEFLLVVLWHRRMESAWFLCLLQWARCAPFFGQMNNAGRIPYFCTISYIAKDNQGFKGVINYMWWIMVFENKLPSL